MSIDLSRVNYGAARTQIDKYINSVGGGASREKNFPGDQVGFKSGEWFRGFGDKARPIKSGTRLVFNIPNMMAGWQTWAESNSGKRFPKYTPMTFPAAGDDPIERESLGDTDSDEWEPDDKGKPQDPWKPTLVFPIRKDGDATVHHVLLTTVSSCIAGLNLFRDVIEEMKLHPGELPIIALGSKKATMDKKETVKGKEKKVKYTWDVPTLEVVDWTDAIAEDNPAKGGVQVTDDGETADLGGVTAKARVNKKANGKAPKALPAPSKKGKPISRKAVEAVEDNEADAF
jgi:hypothetical protein